MSTSPATAADTLHRFSESMRSTWRRFLGCFCDPEFKIPAPALSAEITRRLTDLLTAVPSVPTPPPGPSPEMCRFLTDTAVFLWRMQQRSAKPDGGLDRKTTFQIERLAGVLKETGVETIDLTGQEYRTGQDVRVVAFQPSVTVRVPTVRETLQPFVFFGSQMLLRADIIVDEPEAPPSAPPAGTAASVSSALGNPIPIEDSPSLSTPTSASGHQSNTIAPA